MRGAQFCTLALCLLLYCTGVAVADSAVEVRDFASEELRERHQRLSAELRCPKCSNQSLYESDAMIAADLRRELHRLLHEGLGDDEILSYMTERYGDFIRYRPRFVRDTIALWLTPLLLAAVGLAGFMLWRRRGGRGPAPPPLTPALKSGVRPGIRLRWLLPALALAALALYGAQSRKHWSDWRLGQAFRTPHPADAASLGRLEERNLRYPHNREYALLLGREYLLAGRYREAAVVLERTAQLAPEDARVRSLAELVARLREAVEQDAPQAPESPVVEPETAEQTP